MKEQAIQKINKIGKIGHIVTKISKVLVIISIVATFIGGIVLEVLPKDLINVKLNGQALVSVDVSDIKKFSNDTQEDLIENFDEEKKDGKIYLNGNNYYIDSYAVDENGFDLQCNASLATINTRDIAEICFIVCFYLVISLVSLIFFDKICKSLMTCESPFDEVVIKNLQNFSFSLIPWVVVANIKNVIYKLLISPSASIALNFNIGIVCVVLVILALSYIFKYGAMLQQESDETL